MPVFLLSALLAATAFPAQQVAQLDDGRMRIEIVFDDLSPAGHANAQIAILQAATKACSGKGQAVSEGPLQVDSTTPLRGKRRALALSEVYRCVPTSNGS